MKRVFCLLFLVAVMTTWCSSGFATQDVVSGGAAPGVDMTVTGKAQGIFMDTSSTVPGGANTYVNIVAGDSIFVGNSVGGLGVDVTNKTISAAYATDASFAFMTFNGNSKVFGTIGVDGGGKFKAITVKGIAGTTVDFFGKVIAETMLTGAGTTNFKSGTNDNAVAITFNGDGKVSVAANTWVHGALNAGGNNVGTLELNGGSDWEGATGGASALRSVNVAGNTVAAKITGAVNTNAFSLLTNTLNIDGAITLPAAGTIGTTIASPTVWGNIVQTGAGAVGLGTGLVVNANVTGFVPNGAQFVIVNGTGALTTGTSSVISSNPYVSFSTSVAGNSFILTANRSGSNSFSGVATDSNAAATGGVLDNVTNPSSDMTTVLDALSGSSASQVASSEKSMTPTTDGAITQSATAMLGNFINNTETHLCGLRTGSTTGISTGDNYLNGVDVWAQGLGDYAHQDSRGSSNGYNATSWGVSGGADKSIFNDSVRVGLGSGYGQTFLRSKDFSGRTDIDSIPGTIYGDYENCNYPFYVNAAFTFVYNMYSGSRQVTAGPAITRIANADYDGQQYSGYIEGGYSFFYKKLELTPLASFEYMHLHTESYTETNAGALNLNVASQDYDVAQTGLGAKVAYPVDLKYGTVTPDLHFKWLYDWIGDKQATTAGFAGGGTSFGTQGFAPAQSTYDVGTRLSFKPNNNITLALDYDLLLKAAYYEHYGTVTVKYSF